MRQWNGDQAAQSSRCTAETSYCIRRELGSDRIAAAVRFNFAALVLGRFRDRNISLGAQRLLARRVVKAVCQTREAFPADKPTTPVGARSLVAWILAPRLDGYSDTTQGTDELLSV